VSDLKCIECLGPIFGDVFRTAKGDLCLKCYTKTHLGDWVSNCCGAVVFVPKSCRTTKFYACSKCDEPCNGVKQDE